MVIFVLSPIASPNPEAGGRQKKCFESLERAVKAGAKAVAVCPAGISIPPFMTFIELQRTAKTVLNYEKDVPFVRDVLRVAVTLSSSPDDWVVYLNSDVIIDQKLVSFLQNSNKQTLIGRVRQIGAPDGTGYEVFGFRQHLFDIIDARMPDFIVGELRWDLYTANLFKSLSETCFIEASELIQHEAHEEEWHKRSVGSYYNLHLSDPELFTQAVLQKQDPYGMKIRERAS